MNLFDKAARQFAAYGDLQESGSGTSSELCQNPQFALFYNWSFLIRRRCRNSSEPETSRASNYPIEEQPVVSTNGADRRFPDESPADDEYPGGGWQ